MCFEKINIVYYNWACLLKFLLEEIQFNFDIKSVFTWNSDFWRETELFPFA